MSHYLSGILKIITIEAFMALLVIDRLTQGRFERPKRTAYVSLTALMAFGWTTWGLGRPGTDVGWILAGGAVAWACAFLIRASLGRGTTETAKQVAQGLSDVAQALKVRPIFVAAGLAGLISFGFCWFGVNNNSILWVHQHEQFHFYLGAKYQKEVGWFDLYAAAIMADRETVNVMSGIEKTRDTHTFEERPVEVALAEAPRIRAKFSDERWEAFKRDWSTMTQLWPGMNWVGVMNDHGNSNSPAWSIVASPIASWVPLTRHGQSLLGCLDLLLMLALFLVVFQTFEAPVASTSLFMWACVPVVFDYLAGSFLRFDWLFALGLAVCFLHKERWGTAGALFGYAVATKLFPLFFGVALLIRVAFEWWQTRVIKKSWVSFGRNAALAIAVCIALSSAMFGLDAWKQYAERIQVAQVEKFYSNQHSLKTLVLQMVAPGETPFSTGLFPPVIKQSQAEVNADDYRVVLFIAQLALTGVIALLLRRATPVQAFTLGPLLVFTWLTVNMYYWNMLCLLALGLALRREGRFLTMLLAFFATYITYYTYQHLNRGGSEGYVVGLLFFCITVWGAVMEFRAPATSATEASPFETRL
jgi:hypothetical protein